MSYLPTPLLVLILKQLSSEDQRLSAVVVCKQWNQVIASLVRHDVRIDFRWANGAWLSHLCFGASKS